MAMAAFTKNAYKLSKFNRLLNFKPVSAEAITKRYLRVDPEDEAERLNIKNSFEKRRSLEKAETHRQIKYIGRRPSTKPSVSADFEKDSKQLSENVNVFELRPIPSETIQQDAYLFEHDFKQGFSVLEHYNIFIDLFKEDVQFIPDYGINFKVAYDVDTESVLPVFQGNKIDPSLATTCPSVGFVGDQEKFYSLLLLNLDGHLSDDHSEYLHWSCVNMKGDEGVTSGQSIRYLQPIPFRGTGYHRYVFLLLQHDTEVDTALIPNVTDTDLHSRTFNFSEFYSKLADNGGIPVGIRFFQSEWDSSVKDTFHHVLDMPEPAFEYDYPKIKRPKQVKFAHREPFQKYLDMYRDKKEVAEEVLKEHLSEISPYKPLQSQLPPYPLASPTKPGLYSDQLPATWIQDNMKHKVNKTYKYTYIYKSD
ncbi:large ribosomal subunit protein mL38-like [Watersipora subatra]|uniref:large ribosomal subunit protein mL38-like n=1 Tax=Watersipora subatra TaxID=2589382 RepID=UPI00355AEFEB